MKGRANVRLFERLIFQSGQNLIFFKWQNIHLRKHFKEKKTKLDEYLVLLPSFKLTYICFLESITIKPYIVDKLNNCCSASPEVYQVDWMTSIVVTCYSTNEGVS